MTRSSACTAAPTGADRIVRLSFTGYGNDGNPVYVFSYTPPPEPFPPVAPHDHRDNNPWSGGFAFSVYHPGTSLPQAEWGY